MKRCRPRSEVKSTNLIHPSLGLTRPHEYSTSTATYEYVRTSRILVLMGWAATTTVVSAPEDECRRCWSELAEMCKPDEGVWPDFEWSAKRSGCIESFCTSTTVVKMSKTGPHCGMSDPLLEELSALPHVSVALGLVADGASPRIDGPANTSQILFLDNFGGDESMRCWWLAPASALLPPAGAASSSTPSGPAAVHRTCACGESVHLAMARFCGGCGSKLPTAADDAGRTSLMNRVRRELSLAKQAVTPVASSRYAQGVEGMCFEHRGPHAERAEAAAAPLRIALEAALRALDKMPSQGLELTQNVQAARSSLRTWDAQHDEHANRRFRRDPYGDDEDDEDDDEEAEYGYGRRAGCGRECFECDFTERSALQYASEHLAQVEAALLLEHPGLRGPNSHSAEQFASDGERIKAATEHERLSGLPGFLARAAALGHYLLINYDNDGC